MRHLNKFFQYLTIFLTGASILILEILGTRILAPFYGTTLFVWSALISVTIVFLAIGYFLGGKIADKKSSPKILYSIIFLSAISIFLIPKIDELILTLTDSFGAKIGPFISSLVLFSAPMVLLAMVIPFVIKIQAKKLSKIGETTGNLYAISTVGSFVGAILVAFFLIPNFGVELIISFLAFSLALLSLTWFIGNKKFSPIFILALLIFLPTFNMESNKAFETIYHTQSLLGEIEVIENEQIRILLVDGAIQSCIIIETKESCAAYTIALSEALELMPSAKNALIVGLGGGVISKALDKKGIEFDAVELDEKVFFVAKNYFDYKGDAVIDDGRHFIQNTNKKYDIIILDVYSGNSIPSHMLTNELNEAVKKILYQDGILILNTVGNIESNESLFQRSVYKTLKQSFQFVTYGVVNPQSLGNTVFFASDKNYPIKEKLVNVDSALIFYDDFVPVEFLTENIIEEWRQISKNALENTEFGLIE